MNAALPANDVTEAKQSTKGVAVRAWFARFRQAPLVLQLYLAFVIVVVALGSTVFFAWPLHRVIVPYLGGNSMLYLFTVYCAAVSPSHRRAVYAILVVLLAMKSAKVLKLVFTSRNTVA